MGEKKDTSRSSEQSNWVLLVQLTLIGPFKKAKNSSKRKGYGEPGEERLSHAVCLERELLILEFV